MLLKMMFMLYYIVKFQNKKYKNRMKVTSLTGFPGGSDSTESTCNDGNLGSVPGLGGSPGGGHGSPLFSPGESPSTEEPRGLQSMESQRAVPN